MIGPLSLGKKAAKLGYKRFGKKGAVAGGIAGAGGYALVKRALKRGTTSDESTADNTSEDDGSSNTTQSTAD